MDNSVKYEKKEVLLVISDSGRREYHHVLAVNNIKIEVRTFKEAAEAVRNCNVDIILIDSGSNTEEAIQILKKNKSVCPNIPNIFITNASYEGLVLNVFRSGAYDFFREPVNIIELQETIKGILAVKKKAREIRRPLIHVRAAM